MNNTSIEPESGSDLWYLSWILGKAEQVSPDTHPNKLLVSFNFNPARAVRDRRANYNVMDTDYENYTIGTTFTAKKIIFQMRNFRKFLQ